MVDAYLEVKVFLIHLLIKFKIIRNVWYAAELRLADRKAERLYKLFWD